jgi:chemotaxis protein histidine kinase CheA
VAARVLHTIKGTSGFVGLPRIAATSHAAEDIIRRAPGGTVDVGLLLVALGWIGDLVAAAELHAGREPEGSDDELIALIEQRQRQGANDNRQLLAPSAAAGSPRPDRSSQSLPQRLVPVAKAFELLPTIAAGLGRELGRPLDLKIEGGGVRVNSRIVAALGAPLVQLLRNAASHGIEDAAERAAQGKPPRGSVRIEARLQDADLIVEVSDDGRGFDIAAIGARAVELGLVDAARLASLAEPEIARFAFHPGLSTAAISNISGRGIGLDVVAHAVEALGGSIDLRTRRGSHCTFAMRFPAAQRLELAAEMADARMA